MSTAERIIWGSPGVLSFIVLIVWLRWEGAWEDQKKDEPLEEPKRQAENDLSICRLRAGLDKLGQPSAVTASDGAFEAFGRFFAQSRIAETSPAPPPCARPWATTVARELANGSPVAARFGRNALAHDFKNTE